VTNERSYEQRFQEKENSIPQIGYLKIKRFRCILFWLLSGKHNLLRMILVKSFAFSNHIVKISEYKNLNIKI